MFQLFLCDYQMRQPKLKIVTLKKTNWNTTPINRDILWFG